MYYKSLFGALYGYTSSLYVSITVTIIPNNLTGRFSKGKRVRVCCCTFHIDLVISLNFFYHMDTDTDNQIWPKEMQYFSTVRK